jgi:hypothetical protein
MFLVRTKHEVTYTNYVDPNCVIALRIATHQFYEYRNPPIHNIQKKIRKKSTLNSYKKQAKLYQFCPFIVLYYHS